MHAAAEMAGATAKIFPFPVDPANISGRIGAAAEVFGNLTSKYKKPAWNIPGASPAPVLEKDFCKLVHFEHPGWERKPRILLFAPLSGHYATLVRDTVDGLLVDHDVYVTDWANARDVPVSKGKFGLAEYIDYGIEFMDFLGPNLDVVAVCQPGPAVLAGVALMHQRNDPARPPPKTLTLMGSPIDPDAAPTEVTKYAHKHSIGEFERFAIHQVPASYRGGNRLVYPGWLQLGSFMNMNMKRHSDAHWRQFKNILKNDLQSVAAHRKFYDEYFAVMDLPAEFYLDTVKLIFQERALAKGTLMHNGTRVDLGAITRTAILAIEGEKDDIAAPGQTSAALDLCRNLPLSMKAQYVQPAVGHYGIFAGKKWRAEVRPHITNFAFAHRKPDKSPRARKNPVPRSVLATA